MLEGGILHSSDVIHEVVVELLQGLLEFTWILDKLTDLPLDFRKVALPEQIFPLFDDGGAFFISESFGAAYRGPV